jgi:transposase
MPDGKAVNGFSHCYKRHGTTTLFAALDVATGQVTTGHYARRRRREFLDFMNEVVAENAGKEIHVILDNLNTHKPKRDRWLKMHPQVHLHFTPTYSSWLNQVECWFSILSRSALRGGSFTSARNFAKPSTLSLRSTTIRLRLSNGLKRSYVKARPSAFTLIYASKY